MMTFFCVFFFFFINIITIQSLESNEKEKQQLSMRDDYHDNYIVAIDSCMLSSIVLNLKIQMLRRTESKP